MVSPTQDFNFSIDIFYLILSKASATAQLTRRRTESGQTGGPGRQTAQRSAPDPQYREVFLGGLKLKLELKFAHPPRVVVQSWPLGHLQKDSH